METYECQCNPSNSQCNLIDESQQQFIEEATTTKAKTTKRPKLKVTTTRKTTTRIPETTTEATTTPTKTSTTTMTTRESYLNEPEIREYFEPTLINSTNGNNNQTGNILNFSETISSSSSVNSKSEYDGDEDDDDDEYYYEYDEEESNDSNNGGALDDSQRIIVNNNKDHLSSNGIVDVETETPEITSTSSSTTIITNSDEYILTNKPNYIQDEMDSENVKQKLDVTRVNGRYMSVDTDQLLKYDQIQKNKNKIKKNLKKLKKSKFYDSDDDGDGGDDDVNDEDDNDSDGDGDDGETDEDKNPEFEEHEHEIKYYTVDTAMTEKEFVAEMDKIMKNADEGRIKKYKKINKNYKKDHGACFTGTDSYLHYSDAETMRRIISYQIDLNLRFKTHSSHGLILWTGRHTLHDNDDFLSLGIENG